MTSAEPDALQGGAVGAGFTAVEKAAFGKIAWRIVPLLTIARQFSGSH